MLVLKIGHYLMNTSLLLRQALWKWLVGLWANGRILKDGVLASIYDLGSESDSGV